MDRDDAQQTKQHLEQANPPTVDDVIIQYMKQEALVGHFEHSLNEIVDGLPKGKYATATINQALARLENNHFIGTRKKGQGQKVATFYFLQEIMVYCLSKWGKRNRRSN